MIACKHGRDENVKELLAIGRQDMDDAMDDEEENKPSVAINIKNKHTKAAIHYAAKNGHLVRFLLLVFCDIVEDKAVRISRICTTQRDVLASLLPALDFFRFCFRIRFSRF